MESQSSRNGILEPTQADIAAMCEIFTNGQIHHQKLYPEIFCAPDNQEKIRAYIGSFFKPRSLFRKRSQNRFALGWFENGELKGYLLYQIHKTSDVFFGEDRWSAYVDDIAVGEGSRKKGVASKLLNSLVEKIEELGGGMISGQVWNGNTSSEILFEKTGFEAVAKQFYRVI